MIRVSGIVRDSIVDGPGLRTTVFVQGCPHHCEGCHNPETWPFEGGRMYSAEELREIVRQNPICRGVTLSGGEPFAQAAALCELCRLLREDGYEIAAYTGFTFEELFSGSHDQRELLSLVDVLIDGPFILAQRSLELNFRGSRNQRVLNVPASLRKGAAVLERSVRWGGEG